jgi:tetratricopeptide (TPR) repeat protein
LFKEGDYAGALAAQQHALKLKPDDATLAFNVAMDLEASGRASEAIQMYQRALSIDPAMDDALKHLRALSKW